MVHAQYTLFLKKSIPACDFGQTFQAIVKVMWFECEGSKCRDRNSGPQKKNITKTLSLLLQHQPLGTQLPEEFHFSHCWICTSYDIYIFPIRLLESSDRCYVDVTSHV